MLTISKPPWAGQAQTYHQKGFTAKEQNYLTMESELWAEQIERATADDRKRMGFGPFLVDPGGRLLLLLESIIRSPKPGARVPSTWPIKAAPGWLTLPIGPGWTFQDWCSLGSEWVFEPPDPKVRRVVIVPEILSAERKRYFEERL